MSNDLRLQVVLSAVDRLTRPLKSVQAANQKLAKSLQGSKKSLKELQGRAGDIAAFSKNKQALEKLSGRMKDTQTRIAALSRRIRENGDATGMLTRRQQRAVRTAATLKERYNAAGIALQRERSELARNGISTHNLAQAQVELNRKTKAATEAIENQSRQLKIRGEALAKYQKMQSVRGNLAVSGGMMMAKGTAGLYLLNRPLDEAKHYQQEVSQFRALGVDDKTIRDAQQFADSLNVIGNSVTDNLRTLKEAHSVLRHYGEAKIVTPELLKMQYATKFMAAGQGEALADQSTSVLKIAELRNEINTPEQFKKSVNMTTQAFAASGGLVKPEDYLEAIKTGGESAKNLDDKFFYFGLSHIIQQLGGERTGVSLASLNAGWVGKQIQERSKDALQSLGLATNVTYSKTGHVKDFTLKNQALYQSNPFAYLQQEILPAIRKKYPHASTAQTRNILSSLASNRRAQDLLLLMFREQANIEKQVKAGGEAYNVDQLVSEGSQSAYGREIALEAKKRTLYKKIGQKLMPMYVHGLEMIDSALTRMGNFIDRHPQLAKFFVLTAAGISLAAVAGGALAVAMAGLLGPVAMARYGFTALTGKELPALGSLLKKISFRGIGRAIIWLVRSPLTLLRTTFTALGSVVAALGWPVTLIIGALVAGAFLVWKYWDRVKAWFDGFLTQMQPAWNAIQELFSPLKPLFDAIGSAISGAVKWIEDFLTPVKSTRGELKAASDAGASFGKALSDGILGAIDKIKELWGWVIDVKNNISNMGSNVWDWAKGKMTAVGNALQQSGQYGMPFAGMYDSGGYIPAGAFGMVGERGPELVSGPASVLGRHGTADMIDALMSPLSGLTLRPHPFAVNSGRRITSSPAGGGMVFAPQIHIHAAPGMDENALVSKVMQRLQQMERQAQRRANSDYRDRE
ncbi:hypothetical protein S301_08700 [Salmonella enterica subsp. enterica]|uniref:Phage tail tape measure protein n=1 Tax=Salmonella enterica I TaxID=59201 RepID=A0A5U3EEN0_SALET|nr:hypothetical protein [Salmonella enterica subsp. enterica]